MSNPYEQTAGKTEDHQDRPTEPGHWSTWLTDAFGTYRAHERWMAEASEVVSSAMGRNMAHTTNAKYALAVGYTPADEIYNKPHEA